MDTISAAALFETKHPYSEHPRLCDFEFNTLVLYAPKADYSLHLDFYDHDIQYSQNEDGTLSVKVDFYELNEEVFLENNGYSVEQSDFMTFTDPDVSVQSLDMKVRLELPNSETIDIPDMTISSLDLTVYKMCTKTVTIKAS